MNPHQCTDGFCPTQSALESAIEAHTAVIARYGRVAQFREWLPKKEGTTAWGAAEARSALFEITLPEDGGVKTLVVVASLPLGAKEGAMPAAQILQVPTLEIITTIMGSADIELALRSVGAALDDESRARIAPEGGN